MLGLIFLNNLDGRTQRRAAKKKGGKIFLFILFFVLFVVFSGFFFTHSASFIFSRGLLAFSFFFTPSREIKINLVKGYFQKTQKKNWEVLGGVMVGVPINNKARRKNQKMPPQPAAAAPQSKKVRGPFYFFI